MKIHDPKNTQEITELYAVLSVDEAGKEGICAIGEGFPVPLVFGYLSNLEKIREAAKSLRKKTKKQIVIAKFTHKEIIEVIE